MVTAHTLTLYWTPPTFRGNLPLTGYRVEVLLLGTSLCPQLEPEWEEHQIVRDSSATEVVVTDLVAYQRYQVQVRATNSALFLSDPSESISVWTQQDGELERSHDASVDPSPFSPSVPTAPPSNVMASAIGKQSITVTWQVSAQTTPHRPHPHYCIVTPT